MPDCGPAAAAVSYRFTTHVSAGGGSGLEGHSSGALCGDLFTQGGADCPPVTESDILGPSEIFRKPLDYFAHAVRTSTILERLAALRPKMLACMHGSAFRGDWSELIRGLADVLEQERLVEAA